MIRVTRPSTAFRSELILQERSRPLTAGDLNLLPFDERLNLIQGERGRQKYTLILDAPDPEALVPQLAVQDFYLMVREVGIEDLEEILALATTEQLTALIDFDGWPGDQINAPAALRWLELLLNFSDEKFLQTVKEIDLDLLILMLAKQFKILHAPGDAEDEDLRFEVDRGNGGYVLEFIDQEERKKIDPLLDRLYRLEPNHFYQVMEGIRWETEAQLEEDVFRARCGRLMDLGFTESHAALAVYARIDCADFVTKAPQRISSVSYADEPVHALRLLQFAPPGGLLGTVMERGIPEVVANDLIMLINKVISADRIDPSDDKELRATTARIYGLLNLALEDLCSDDVATATQLFETLYPEDLFRYAFSLTLQLQSRARKIAVSPLATFLDGPYRIGIEALSRNRPAFHEGIFSSDQTGERPFSGGKDFQAAQSWICGVEAQQRFFMEYAPFRLPDIATLDLTGCEPADFEDLTLSDLFLTALANRLLGGDFQPRPLPSTSLLLLHQRVSSQGVLDRQLREETVKRLEEEISGLGPFVDWSLDLWQDGFCAIPPEELDPRYISGLIIKI